MKPFFNSDFNAQLRTNGMKAYLVEGCSNILHTYSRRDYYKISLLSGTGVITYGDRSIQIDGSVLLVTKPDVVFTWNLLATQAPSYTCVITHEFLESRCFDWINQCNLFCYEHPKVYELSFQESRFLSTIFQKMVDSESSPYLFKGELLKDQICVLLHTAQNMKPSENFIDFTSTIIASSRYVELAEMQFQLGGQILHFN